MKVAKLSELLQLALDKEYSGLAHFIYYFIHEGLANYDDDFTVIENMPFDQKKVDELTKQNVLQIYPIYPYSLKMFPNKFVFIFAKSQEEAVRYYVETHGIRPINCIQMDLDREFKYGNKTITFRELRKEHDTFPAIALYYERAARKK